MAGGYSHQHRHFLGVKSIFLTIKSYGRMGFIKPTNIKCARRQPVARSTPWKFNSSLLKIAIDLCGFSHEKCWFSIAFCMFTRGYAHPKDSEHQHPPGMAHADGEGTGLQRRQAGRDVAVLPPQGGKNSGS